MGTKRGKIQEKEMEKVIYQLIIDGYSTRRIIDVLMTKYEYKTEVNCYRIINKVVKSLHPDVDEEIIDLKNKYIEMYNDLYKRALEEGETKTASSIMDSIVKLQGLITTKIEAKVDTVYTIEF